MANYLRFVFVSILGLQERFNEDMLLGHIRPSGFQCDSENEFLAHDDSILAYKLMVSQLYLT